MACARQAQGEETASAQLLGGAEKLLHTVADALLHADRDDFGAAIAEIHANLDATPTSTIPRWRQPTPLASA